MFIGSHPRFPTSSMHSTAPCSQDVAISLLRVATKLGCGTIQKFAKDRLRALWPLTAPRGRKRKELSETIAIIALARELDLPEVLKCAFYELLRNSSFWDMVVTKRGDVKLADADVLNLYHTRHVLQQEWRALVLTPPSPGSACLGPQGQQRCASSIRAGSAGLWRSYFIEMGSLEMGAADPMCYVDVLRDGWLFRNMVNEDWCRSCTAERKAAWEGAKTRWWDMLDGLLKIGTKAEADAAQ